MRHRTIAIVLLALADLEGWDGDHPSIVSDPDSGWKFKDGLPVPSRELVKAIRRVEARYKPEAAR